jgi:hypothetical protein
MPDTQYCTKTQAEQQAEAIRNYWRARGIDVETRIESHATGKQGRGSVYYVRSDIKLGAVGGGGR